MWLKILIGWAALDLLFILLMVRNAKKRGED